MKELMVIIDKPYSYCKELMDYLEKEVGYTQLPIKPCGNVKLMTKTISNADTDKLVCIAKPGIALKIKTAMESNDIKIKLLLVSTKESDVLHRARKADDDILRVSAIERLSVEGLGLLMSKTKIDIILDGSATFGYIKEQFDIKYKISEKKDEYKVVRPNTGDIVYKCALHMTQAKALVEMGLNKFEIHTDDRFICDPDAFKIADEFLDVFPDIVTVHSPLDSNMAYMSRPSCTLSHIAIDKATHHAIDMSMHFAQKCAEKYMHRVGVVIHNESTIQELFIDNDGSAIKKKLQKLLAKYPEVDLYIENTTPMEPANSFGDATLHGGCFTDTSLIVRSLNNALSDRFGERFFTCLDTCHMTASFKVYKALGLPINVTKEDMFKEYGDTCKQIHLAWLKNFGINPEEHGIGFQNYVKELKVLLDYIDMYMPNANIVLEMKEKDYCKPSNSVWAADYINKRRENISI